MSFPFQEKPEKVTEIIGQKIDYWSILVVEKKPMIPLLSWIKTGNGVWHRFFIDAWVLHWTEFDEMERQEAIEEDFEDGSVRIDEHIWVVRNIMDEYNLADTKIADAQLVYVQEKQVMCAQLQIYLESNLVIYLNDYGDEIDARLIIKNIA